MFILNTLLNVSLFFQIFSKQKIFLIKLDTYNLDLTLADTVILNANLEDNLLTKTSFDLKSKSENNIETNQHKSSSHFTAQLSTHDLCNNVKTTLPSTPLINKRKKGNLSLNDLNSIDSGKS